MFVLKTKALKHNHLLMVNTTPALVLVGQYLNNHYLKSMRGKANHRIEAADVKAYSAFTPIKLQIGDLKPDLQIAASHTIDTDAASRLVKW